MNTKIIKYNINKECHAYFCEHQMHFTIYNMILKLLFNHRLCAKQSKST